MSVDSGGPGGPGQPGQPPDRITLGERLFGDWVTSPVGPAEYRWLSTALIISAVLTPVAGTPGWFAVTLLGVLGRCVFEAYGNATRRPRGR